MVTANDAILGAGDLEVEELGHGTVVASKRTKKGGDGGANSLFLFRIAASAGNRV